MIKCPLCDSSDVEVKSAYRGIHPTFKNLNRAHCNACSIDFATPMPDDKSLSEFNASYFESAHGGSATNIVALAFFCAIARLRHVFLEKYLSNRQIVVSSVLEFGPGPGFFANAWLAQHPLTTYMARETDISCHAGLREMGVQLINKSAIMSHCPSVDLVVMSHILEHVTAPKIFINEATKNLRNGGVLFIEVPCLDYQHKPIDEPHLLFFDKISMHHLLTSAGFENIELGYFGPKINSFQLFSMFRSKWISVRSRLISAGVVWPFCRRRDGLESLKDPLERAVVAPFKAHSESPKPTWWLRVVAQKRLT